MEEFLEEVEGFENRLLELDEAKAAKWFPGDLLDSLHDPDVLFAIEGLVADHDRPENPLVGLGLKRALSLRAPLDRFFLYEPDHLLVHSSVLAAVKKELHDQGRLVEEPGEDEERVFDVARVKVDIKGTSIPQLALQLAKAFDDKVAPNHVLSAGKGHAGGGAQSPRNRLPHEDEPDHGQPDHDHDHDHDHGEDGRVDGHAEGLLHAPVAGPERRIVHDEDLEPIPAPTGDAGKHCTIAVIDSGILPSFDRPQWMLRNVATYTDDDIEHDYRDRVGSEYFIRYPRVHGTFVVGIIKQLAPGARILVKRAVNKYGVVTEFEFGRAVQDVLSSVLGAPDIINCSLGGPSWKDTPPLVTAAAAEAVAKKKIIMVAAAGNGSNTLQWPAQSPHALGVGCVNRKGQRSTFSNFGEPVNVWALGEDVTSVYATGVFARPSKFEHSDVDYRPFAGVAAWSGTSFAAPRVTGLVAAEMRKPRTAAAALQRVLHGDNVVEHAAALPLGAGREPAPLVLQGLSVGRAQIPVEVG